MTKESPFVVALCPTYRHPDLLANSLALWDHQDYPVHSRHLVIADSGDTFRTQEGKNWSLFNIPRPPTFTQKYNWILNRAIEMFSYVDAFLVWEDDDIYLPGYVNAHAQTLKEHEYSCPQYVLSDYPGHLIREREGGRFHSSIGFTKGLITRIGGWVETKRADFDQQLKRKLRREATSVGCPWGENTPQFIYHWRTQESHTQNCMKGADDESWYDRCPDRYREVDHVGDLAPRMQKKVINWINNPITYEDHAK